MLLSRAVVALTCLAGLLAAPVAVAQPTGDRPEDDRVGAGAPYAVVERDVQIPVPDADAYGDPVVLDARVTVPQGDGPFAGLVVNHGYLGSKTGDGDLARKASALGYIVLRYSSRGFGATKGQVDLVGPKEQRDLLAAVDWLNDRRNVPIWKDHIGQYGGSYGGAHALALARSGHKAVRAVIAAATWTDAYQGLLPNGVLKQAYLTGFYGAGRLRQDGYNNYEPAIDLAYAKTAAGVDLDGVRSFLDARSTVGKWDDVQVPVFFAQGLNDGLFDGNAAIDGFQQLQRRGVPSRLYLGGLGHPPSRSGGGPEIARVEQQAVDWLDHHVRGVDNGIDTASPIEFARTQWFGNDTETAPSRVAAATSYPFGEQVPLALCGSGPGRGTLSATACPGALPVVLASGTGGDPTSEPVGGRLLGEGFQDAFGRPFPSAATPVDVAVFESAPLTAPVDHAGIPTLDLQVLSPSTGAPAPTSGAVAFQAHPKLYDVAPDGTARLITRGAYAEQLGAPAGPHRATYDAFAFAWRFEAGHRIRLSLSSADVPYLRPASNAFAVAVLPGSRVLLPGAERATAPRYEER